MRFFIFYLIKGVKGYAVAVTLFLSPNGLLLLLHVYVEIHVDSVLSFYCFFFSSIFYFDFKETTKTLMHIISCLLFPSSSRTFIITTLKFNTSVFPTAIPSHIISLKKLK